MDCQGASARPGARSCSILPADGRRATLNIVSKQPFRAVTLPVGWPEKACDAAVQAMGIAHLALTQVRGWCADSRIARVRLAAKLERAEAEVALLREELRIKDA